MGYSQRNEEQKIIEYFRGAFGTCLSIGENDGVTYSNVRQLILNGWQALLVEPSPLAYKKLRDLYDGNDDIALMNVAIGPKNERIPFWESGTHLNKDDVGLLSTAMPEEKLRWKDTTDFTETWVWMTTFQTILLHGPYKEFDFISIDAEGFDFVILTQMDLDELGCKAICVEHNGSKHLLDNIRGYCGIYGLKDEILMTPENIILAR